MTTPGPQGFESEDFKEAEQKKTVQLLVLGVGNIMMGDYGIGVRVARYLNKSFVFPDVVDIVEGGEDGMSLLPAIRSAEEVVIVDAVSAAAKPGSIFMFNSEEIEIENSPKLSLHDTGILEAIRTAALMEDGLDATIIGIQPKKVEEFGSELSKPVARNMSRVVEIILDLMASRDLNPEPRDSRSMVNPSEWNNSA